ncbi:hypothetical protein GOP47_0016866 [Adiantum capillus-veneris]|uniref:Amidase domain-containing protein n=1 Tax=Adiantum capillus-veneris TaxID=13818 RepID=A0A9D4UJG0_ADICA|nr:hypothetical protein GOP47_0016866 [Adiantum capillus-veneris]
MPLPTMSQEEMHYKPAELVSTDADSDASADYIYVDVKAPILAGLALKCFAWTLESRLVGRWVLQYLKNENLITKIFLKSRFHEPPMYTPNYVIKDREEPSMIQIDPTLSACERSSVAADCLASSDSSAMSFRRWTIRDYSKAYKSGTLTPTMVAERFLQAVKESLQPAPGMGFFINYSEEEILKQAELSTSRYNKGTQLSILDGVPIAVKDEIDCLPYPTTGGSKWLPKARKVTEDAAAVQRLRECGALLVGKTNMHELGMGTTGINPHYGASRNPYDSSRISGGSSGGSAAVVSAGLCPAALGVDGGGSVRMPSALCGIVGFKATFGRISSSGVLPLNWTLGMVGVHAATVEDALIMYAVMNGHLPSYRTISIPPPTNLPLLKEFGETQGGSPISGIRFAKYTKWFEDCDETVHETCYKALNAMQQRYGCKVVEVTLPEIEEMRLGHYITIGSECWTSLGLDYNKWGRQVSAFDTRVSFAVYSCFTNREFLAAQRLRHRQMHFHMEIFKKADILVTPTSGCTAQPIPEAALKVGELNYVVGAKMMHYQIAANFLGLPAITIPVGYDADGLPIGLQLLGPPWSEATLLRVAYAIESLCVTKRPEIFYDLLA